MTRERWLKRKDGGISTVDTKKKGWKGTNCLELTVHGHRVQRGEKTAVPHGLVRSEYSVELSVS